MWSTSEVEFGRGSDREAPTPSPRRSSSSEGTHMLALSALLWTTKCHSSWNVKCLHVMYKYALCPYSAFFFSFSLNAAAAAKLCIECISKDCPRSGCMLVRLGKVFLKRVFVRCGSTGIVSWCRHVIEIISPTIQIWLVYLAVTQKTNDQ